MDSGIERNRRRTKPAVKREPKTLEFPPGSGLIAIYSPEEQEFLLPFIDEALSYPPGHPVRTERDRECRFFHELKVELGVDLVRDQVSGVDEP